MSFDIMSFLMGQKAGGGGGGGGSNIFEWDFKSATPLVDKIRGDVASIGAGVTLNSSGAVFSSPSNAYIVLSTLVAGITIEVDVAEMQAQSGARFLCADLNSNYGFYYRSSTGKWACYNGATVDSDITDGDFFSGHICKVHIDSAGKWHIYRDNELVFEPNLSILLKNRFSGEGNLSLYLGSASSAISNAIIAGVRVY